MLDSDTSSGTNAASAPARLLFVDDEPSILSSLKRLFHAQGHTIFTANSGAEGLAILDKETIDAVVSDMRMPEMDGAQFLEEVFKRRPETKRILLTGYADAASTVAAINRGKIWRYIAKPWNDDELITTVNQALTHRNLMAENAGLIKLTTQQNEELKTLNASLEEKVAQRTDQLVKAMSSLESANQQLRKGFVSTVTLFSGLVEQRGRLSGHSRRVANIARQIAERMHLPDADLQDVIIASLLLDIGKLGLPDHLLNVPLNALAITDKTEFMKHPIKGAHVLAGIEQLAKAARIIRHQNEYLDGSGYPDKLAGLSIPLGSRIVCVANDYDALQHATLMKHLYQPEEAREFILKERGKHYDPAVVKALMASIEDIKPTPPKELVLRPSAMVPGMVIAHDLKAEDGNLIMASGQEVDHELIVSLKALEKNIGTELKIHVFADSPATASNDKSSGNMTELEVNQLAPGMTLAHNLSHKDGYLILAQGMQLDDWMIKELNVLALAGSGPAKVTVNT